MCQICQFGQLCKICQEWNIEQKLLNNIHYSFDYAYSCKKRNLSRLNENVKNNKTTDITDFFHNHNDITNVIDIIIEIGKYFFEQVYGYVYFDTDVIITKKSNMSDCDIAGFEHHIFTWSVYEYMFEILQFNRKHGMISASLPITFDYIVRYMEFSNWHTHEKYIALEDNFDKIIKYFLSDKSNIKKSFSYNMSDIFPFGKLYL